MNLSTADTRGQAFPYRFGHAVGNILAQIGMALLLVFSAMTVADGFMRWLFNFPLDIVRDIGGLWIAVGMSCCFPLAFLEGRNIVMDLVESLAGAVTNKLLDLFSALVVAIFLFFFALQFWRYAGNVARAGETSMTLEIPAAPFWYVVDANLWLTLLMQLLVLARAAGRLAANNDPHR